MKAKIASIMAFFIVLFLFTSGIFQFCTEVFVWLITLNAKSSTISKAGELFVKYSTWLITYTIVGFIFKKLKWFDSDAMKIVYFVISTLISFALSYVIMIFEKYILWIALGILIMIVIAVVIVLTLYFVNKKRTKKSEKLNEN